MLSYDETMKWNDRLKEARIASGMSKSQFARAMGVSAPTVTEWENGKIQTLKAENLIKAGRLLGLKEGELHSGEPGARQLAVVPPGEVDAQLIRQMLRDASAEVRMLTVYRLADADNRGLIDDAIDDVIDRLAAARANKHK